MNSRVSVLGSVLIGLLAAGCAPVQKGLIGEKHENIGPFAEATVEFLGSATVDLRANELIYLRMYYEEDAPEITRLKNLLARVDGFRDEVVFYSVELVRISEENDTEAAKCADLADTLMGEFRDTYIEHTDISPGEFDATVERIRNQEKLLDALQVLQPLIVKTGEYYESLIREAENEALPAAIELIDARIEDDYAAAGKQLDIVVAQRDELFTELQNIYAFRKGDDSALAGNPSEKELLRRKEDILKKLEFEERIQVLLDRDVEAYVATRAELALEEAEVLDGLSLARRQVIAWIRTHQKLANGVREPGKWFLNILKIAEGVKKAS